LTILILFYIAIFIISIVISYFIAKEFYKAALMKGWNSKKYFWIPFLLGLVGYLLVIALPDRGGVQHMSVMISDDLPEL